MVYLYLCQSAFSCEEKGSVILWKYDQRKEEIKLHKIKEAMVCEFTENQLSSNISIKFFKDKKVVFEQKVFWDNISNQESVVDGKIVGEKFKTTDFKIFRLPYRPTEVDYYIVYDFVEKKNLGQGEIR
jgi:hypothetical protein